ncbi:MAG: hypothetical protein FWF29_03055, partial [Treponema sp.]|nr:hypothetical protein [Treponema sp.]
MKKLINKFISKYVFTEQLALEYRAFNLVLIFGIFAEIIAVIVRIVEGVSVLAILAVFGMILVTVFTFWLCNHFHIHKVGIWICSLLIFDVLFPLIFFTNGGAKSGMTGYFVLCIVLIFFLFRGIQCLIMVLIHIAVMFSCYIIGILHPGLVIPFTSDVPMYIDIIHTIL